MAASVRSRGDRDSCHYDSRSTAIASSEWTGPAAELGASSSAATTGRWGPGGPAERRLRSLDQDSGSWRSRRPLVGCRSWSGSGPGRKNQGLAVALFLALAFQFCALSQEQAIEFAAEPEKVIYAKEGTIKTIPCHAIEVDTDGNKIRDVGTTLYVNSQEIDVYRPPNRLWGLASDEGVPIGFMLNPVAPSDAGNRYQCTVGIGGGQTLNSSVGELVVGDGTPGPTTSVSQVGKQQLYSIDLRWSEAPTPTHLPILNYELSLTPVHPPLEEELFYETQDNDTEFTAGGLAPGTVYSLVVYGVSEEGRGVGSSPVEVETLTSLVPPCPTDVKAVVTDHSSSASIFVSWKAPVINPEIMTPVDRYVVFYGTKDLPLNMSTEDNSTFLNITGIKRGGAYSIGVAAVNSRGLSRIKNTSSTIDVPDHTTNNALIISLPVVGFVILVILLILVTAVCLCRRCDNKSHSGEFELQHHSSLEMSFDKTKVNGEQEMSSNGSHNGATSSGNVCPS